MSFERTRTQTQVDCIFDHDTLLCTEGTKSASGFLATNNINYLEKGL